MLYCGRKEKKKLQRTLITRINAELENTECLTLNLWELFKKNNIELNRKVLQTLVMNHPEAFKAVVDQVK